MFTGIITGIGTVTTLRQAGDLRARINSPYASDGIALGASIACDGVCLTVVNRGPNEAGAWFDVDVSAETLSKTTIGHWREGQKINLERALCIGDEIGGHVVSGHVDGVAEVTNVRQDGDSTRVTFKAPEALARFIAEKGSVALNGTSLTVNDVDGVLFDINFIPHTKSETTWGDIHLGDRVNLEIDTLARYVARLSDFTQNASAPYS